MVVTIAKASPADYGRGLGDVLNSIVRVGIGCGFVVEISGKRLVLSAAHCLPVFRQYKNLALCTEIIGPLGEIPTNAGTCLSIDVINDLAVIGPPPYPHRTGFERMVMSVNPFAIATAKEGRGWVMRLDGGWEPVRIDHIAGLSLQIRLEREIDLSGSSGAPIIDEDGAAVSLVASQYHGERRSGPCPHLVAALPSALAPCSKSFPVLPPPPSRPRNWTAASTEMT
jgi:hypothetical protein